MWNCSLHCPHNSGSEWQLRYWNSNNSITKTPRAHSVRATVTSKQRNTFRHSITSFSGVESMRTPPPSPPIHDANNELSIRKLCEMVQLNDSIVGLICLSVLCISQNKTRKWTNNTNTRRDWMEMLALVKLIQYEDRLDCMIEGMSRNASNQITNSNNCIN